ncbi:hypothetical protein SAMN05216224_10741 [Thioclava dalianensis]|nr:hypothetical protein SAMN05216224_10741 [Thioclava dalianensis]
MTGGALMRSACFFSEEEWRGGWPVRRSFVR